MTFDIPPENDPDKLRSPDALDELEEYLRKDREYLLDRHVPSSDRRHYFSGDYGRGRHEEEDTEGFSGVHVCVAGADREPATRNPDAPPAACYGLEYGDLHIRFTDFSWGQFVKKINLPKAFARMLHREDRFLLAQNMQHCLDRRSEYLLRLRRLDTDSSAYQLRALLDINYNRLDSLYLIRPIRRLCEREEMELGKILFDGDTLAVHLLKPKAKKLLEEVGDEVMTGVTITNSDIGQTSTLTMQAYYERLECANGMTMRGSLKVIASQSLYDRFGTRYWDELPPFPLEDFLQEELAVFFENGWHQFSSYLEMDLDNLRHQLQKLKEIEIDVEGERSVKSHIEAMLLHSGLRVHPGISVPAIYEAYQAELESFPAARNSALILYHAVTRYASNHLTSDNPDASTRRAGRGRPRQTTRADNLQLSRTLTNLSYRLLPNNLKWEKVLETARREKAIRMRLPEV